MVRTESRNQRRTWFVTTAKRDQLDTIAVADQGLRVDGQRLVARVRDGP